ncbi:MAG: hypothetical protein ACOH2J_08930 [Allorhizobium sp.]
MPDHEANGSASLLMDPVPASAQGHAQFIRVIATFTLIGALTYNLVLCFANTRIMGITDSYLMLFEMMFVGGALLAAFDRRLDIYLILVLFLSYMMMLFAFRQQADLKAVRDILIPIAFYFMGTRVKDVRLADRLVIVSVTIVLVIGLFEYFLTDLYLDNFNVLGYYLSRGAVTSEEVYGATKGLFVSGVRGEPRTLLSFLGQHRVSSVFLEPVSSGNFGVIIYAWALFRNGMRRRFAVMAAALAVIIFADARFGFYTCILITLMLPFFRLLPRTIWLVMPFFMLAAIAAYGLATGIQGGPNDIGGRIDVTAGILNRLNLSIVLGIESIDLFTADSGLGYTLTNFGIFGFAGLWCLLVLAPVRDARAWIFHSMVIIYILLLMIISNSFYSIKTAALLWFLLGTADQVDWSAYLPKRKIADTPPDAGRPRVEPYGRLSAGQTAAEAEKSLRKRARPAS